MSGWYEAALGDFIHVQHGYAFRGSGITAEERPQVLVTPGNFYIGGGFKSEKFKYFDGEYPDDYVLREGEIVVTMTDLSKDGDTLGYGAKIPANTKHVYLHNQRIGRVRWLTKDIDKEYLYWVLRTPEYQGYILGAATGTAVRHTSPSTIIKYRWRLPLSTEEQQAIAGVLSSLDEKIDLLHRQNKTLDAMTETLFRQWFVASPQDGWKERSLSSVANFLNGLACQKYPPDNILERLPVLKIRELSGGISESSDWATDKVKSEYIVEAGDVIFAWSASLMVKVWDGARCVLNQHLFKVTSDEFPKWFHLMWCKHHLAEFIAISASHATTMGHIKRSDLDAAMVLVPSPPELEAMSAQMSPLLEKQIANARQIKTLESLRDTLLPKLMSGEVRVAY
jgi:type I restriction enzyme S subunit